MMSLTADKILIIIVGMADWSGTSLTLCGFPLFMKFEAPLHIDVISTDPTILPLWFYVNIVTCTLFWMASINMVLKAIYGDVNDFRKNAFMSWLILGLMALILSVLGNTLEGKRAASLAMVVIRILFIATVYFAMTRWKWEETEFSMLSMGDEEMFVPRVQHSPRVQFAPRVQYWGEDGHNEKDLKGENDV